MKILNEYDGLDSNAWMYKDILNRVDFNEVGTDIEKGVYSYSNNYKDMKIISNEDCNKSIQTVEEANNLINNQQLEIEFLRLENEKLSKEKIEVIDRLNTRLIIYTDNYYSESNQERARDWVNMKETIEECLNIIK